MYKIAVTLILCLALLAVNAPGSPSVARPDCQDTFIASVPSPDGMFAVYLYHRKCMSANYTYATLRRLPPPPSEDGHVCYLVTLSGTLKIKAVWKDATHVEISSPDRLSWERGISSQQDSCKDINISYDLNIEPAPPDKSSDPKVEAAIRKAIALSTPCLSERNHPGNIRMFYCNLEQGDHRSAVSLLLMHLYDYNCPVSEEAYALLKMAGMALQVESDEWKQIRPQVTTARRAETILSRLRRQAEVAKARIRRRVPDSSDETPQRLFDVYLDHKKGFIDATGQIVIEPQFEDTVDGFSDGMARVPEPTRDIGRNTKYGYIDATGRVVIEPQFEKASDFREGLAWVEMKMWLDGPSGFIDKTGRIVIPLPKQSDTPRFSEGLAAVSLASGFGFIDKEGKTIIEPVFGYAGDFSEGLAWVRTGDKAGYIDKTGKIVIGPSNYKVSGDESNFSEGLAMVRLGGKAGYIDRTGRVVIRPRFGSAHPFHSGLARVSVNGKEGYVDRRGRMVIKPRYALARDFSEGLAIVEVRGRGYGYIDTKGRMAVSPQFQGAEPFVEGVARVHSVERGVGYIDKKGSYVWGPLH